MVSYFEAFCKDLFALSLNVYPELLERLRDWDGHDFNIDPLMTVHLGDKIRDKVGFIVSERLDFGTAKEVNSLYTRLLKVTPFSRDEMQRFSDLLRDRHLFVHHGGSLTYRYLRQVKGDQQDAHWQSLVIDRAAYFRHHDFIEGIIRKMLKGAHREMTDFGKTKYRFEENAPVESLLDWDDVEPMTLDELQKQTESKSLYAEMLERKAAEEEVKLRGDEDSEHYSESWCVEETNEWIVFV